MVHQSFGNKRVLEYSLFDKVRKVTISENEFMNCICGKTGDYMFPFARMCKVIDKNEYLTL